MAPTNRRPWFRRLKSPRRLQSCQTARIRTAPAWPGCWPGSGSMVHPVLGFLLLALAVLVLHRALQQITYREFSERIVALGGWRIGLSLALTALSFITLAGYEQGALRFIGKRLPWPRTSLVAFVTQSIAHSTGFAAFVGVGLRYRIYVVRPARSCRRCEGPAVFSSTFVLGVMALSGLALAFEPQAVAAAVAMPVEIWRLIGVLLLATVVGYLVLSSAGGFTAIRVGHRRVSLPRARTTALQILLATIDLAAAAGALYVLLPGLDVGYVAFVGLFTAAVMVGVLSHVPGGLGVFDSLLLLMLQPAPEQLPAVISGLVVFRLLTTAAAADRHWGARRAGIAAVRAPGARARAARGIADGAAPVRDDELPRRHRAAGLRGAAGRTRASRRARRIDAASLIELSHFTGSLAGMALLLLARVSTAYRRGLEHDRSAAYGRRGRIAGEGLRLRGGDRPYDHAVRPDRQPKEFYRRASLFDQRPSLGWLIAIGAALLGTVWLIGFAYRHVEYAHDLWWQFALQADAPRSLRAVVGAAVLLGTFGIMRLLRPSPARPRPPTSQELDDAQALVLRGTSNDDWLALTGDKPLLFERRAGRLHHVWRDRPHLGRHGPAGGSGDGLVRADLAVP